MLQVRVRVLLLFLLLVFLLRSGNGVEGQGRPGSCSRRVNDAPSECQPFVYSTFYLPPESLNVTLNFINQQATIGALSLSPVENKCRIPGVKFACASAYQPCTTFALSPSLPNFLVFPLPLSPCRSLCESMVSSCKDFLSASDLPNCSQVDPSTGQPSYPTKYSTYEVNGVTYQVPCNDYPAHHDVGATEQCPLPLKHRHHGKEDADPPCQLPCPFPYWSENQWQALWITMDVLAPIGFFAALWVVICWLSQERLRAFPAHLPLFTASAAVLADLVWAVSSIVGHREIMCPSEFTVGGPLGLCGAQAFLLHIAVLITLFYFFFICLTLFLMIALEVQLDTWKWYPYAVHIIGLGCSLVFPIISLANKTYVGQPGFCFMALNDHLLFYLLLAYAWIGLFITLNLAMGSSVFVKLSMVNNRSRRRRAPNWRHVGMMIFVAIFFFVFAWGFSYFVYIASKRHEFKESVMDWVLCNAQLKDNCTNHAFPSYWAGFTTVILFTMAGIWNFLSFSNRRSLHTTAIYFLGQVFLHGRFRLLLTGLPDSEVSTIVAPTSGKMASPSIGSTSSKKSTASPVSSLGPDGSNENSGGSKG